MTESKFGRYIRFLKFAAVGGTGVVVNLAIYALLTRLMGMGDTLLGQDIALLVSIEISIISNFILNDMWTFKDRTGDGGFWKRMLKFHVVSVAGSLIQWGVARGLYRLMLAYDITVLNGRTIFGHTIVNWDDLLLVCVGIGIAMFWNFFANLYWTWRKKD